MFALGKTTEEAARKFVLDHEDAVLRSRSLDGLRRVATTAKNSELEKQRTEFAKIASSSEPRQQILATIEPEPLPCIHRGAKRHTCCGSPSLWMCRKLKEDCVADVAAAEKLRSMVATNEAANVKVCATCQQRADSPDLWPVMTRRPDEPVRVGFLSAAYMRLGGTETFHRSLLPRLKQVVNVSGFAATGFYGGDGSLLQVPYATGVESAKRLASHCDLLVVWGIQDLATILPEDRPRVIAVHHSDWSSDWNNSLVLNQLEMIDEIVCVNEQTAAELSKCGKPVHFIPNAIDPERVKPSGSHAALREQFQIPRDAKIVLFGHRLSAEKRPQLAVQIARLLPDGWMMVIAGDGQQKNAVENLSSGCDRIRVVGACESLADWLSIADCFLSLSTFEGFGLSVGEALAAGVATVSTATGIAPGLATTLPADSSPAEWASAIVTAKPLVEPEVILERYSVHRMVSAWADVIARQTGQSDSQNSSSVKPST